VASGETWKRAGDRLGISPRTVEFHIYSFRRKIAAQNCLEALAKLIL